MRRQSSTSPQRRRGTVHCCLALFLTALSALAAEEPKTPRTDLYGDPLPPGAMMRLGTIRLRHAGTHVVFSKDGKQLISCDRYGEVRFWDVATGKRLRDKRMLWQRDLLPVKALALSSGEATAAVWNGKTVELYDTNAAKKRNRIPSLDVGDRLSLMEFSPDGKLLAVQSASDRRNFTTQIWDVVDVKRRQPLKVPGNVKLSSIAINGAGKRLAGIAKQPERDGQHGIYYDLFLWDTTTGKLIGRREDLGRIDARGLTFSPDGKALAVVHLEEDRILFLDATTLKQQQLLKIPPEVILEVVTDLAFSPDGRYLAAAYGYYPINQQPKFGVVLWELTGAKRTRRLPAREETLLAFSPYGKTLACHDGGAEIRLYNTLSGRRLPDRPGHDRDELALALSPDGKLVASGDGDGVLHLWDAATSKPLRMMENQEIDITACLFSPDSKRVVAIGKTGYITGAPPIRIAFQVWNVADGKALRRIETKDFEVPLAAAISADGKRLAAVLTIGDDPPEQLVVWDLTSGKRLSQRPYKLQTQVDPSGKALPQSVAHPAFAPDGDRLTVWLGDRVGIEDVSSGCLLAKLPKGMGRPLVFSPDGRFLAATIRKPNENDPLSDDFKGLSLIEAASGQEVLRIPFESAWLFSLAFTGDGRGILAAYQASTLDAQGMAESPKLRVWDTATGAIRYKQAWPENVATAFSSDTDYSSHLSLIALPGGRVATAMTEGDILVWDWGFSPKPPRKQERDLGREELQSLWSDLSGDARKAYRAIHTLTAAPDQTIVFFRENLRPATSEIQGINKLLADLDSDSFETRQAATHELTRLHYRAESMLRRRLESKPSLEMRRRIQAILTEPRLPQADDLRMLRSIAVLERIGTPEARRILDKLAGGADAPETREAQTALQRLKRRDASANGRTLP